MIFSRARRLDQNRSEEDIGFRILSDTADEHKENLAGIETEQVYLTAGTYHRLADRLAVGWHPQFEKIMQEGDKDE